MKLYSIFYFVISIIPTFARLGEINNNKTNINQISGDWIQVLSSRYVQETSEIDWDCVKVNIKFNNDNSTIIHKNAFLHQLEIIPINNTKLYSLSLNQKSKNFELISKVNSTISPNLEFKYIHKINQTVNYFILTGSNNMSLYVLAKSFNDYKNHKNEINKLLTDFQYTSYYKYALPSYSSACK